MHTWVDFKGSVDIPRGLALPDNDPRRHPLSVKTWGRIAHGQNVAAKIKTGGKATHMHRSSVARICLNMEYVIV